MKVMWVIATTTFKEQIRRRILNVILIFSIAVIVSSISFSHLQPGAEWKVVQDISLAIILLTGVLICILVTAGLIPAELERKTLFTILSKPVRRVDFIVGKFLGAVLTVFANLTIMSIVSIIVLGIAPIFIFKGGPRVPTVTWEIGKAIILVYFEMVVLTAVVVAVSTVASTVFNIIFSVFVLILGTNIKLIEDLSVSAIQAKNYVAGNLLRFLYAVVPHLQNFDVRKAIRDEVLITPKMFWQPILYGIGYSALMLLLAYWFFREKEA